MATTTSPILLDSTGQSIVTKLGDIETAITNGGGGSSTLSGLTDVTITSPTDGQSLAYDSVTTKWINVSPNHSYSSTVSCLVGDTTCTITDANILTTSIIEPYTQNSSGNPISYTNIAVTTGQAIITFSALEEATDFIVKITNL